MSKNTRALSHLSTSFNTVAMHPDQNIKSFLNVMNENQRNIEQMIYFKGELLALQDRVLGMRTESQEQKGKMRGQIERLEERNKELEERKEDLNSTVQGLLLRKVELEESLRQGREMSQGLSEELAGSKERLKEKVEEGYRMEIGMKELEEQLKINEELRESMSGRVKELGGKLSCRESELFQLELSLEKARNENKAILSQKSFLAEENQRIKMELERIKSEAFHQQYKVQLLEQTLNGGLGDLKSLEDKARKQLENQVNRLKELLESYEKMVQGKGSEVQSIREETKNRIGCLMEQVSVLQELNIELENQNQGLKAQLQTIRVQNQNKMSQRQEQVKRLESNTSKIENELHEMLKLYKSSKVTIQQKQSQLSASQAAFNDQRTKLVTQKEQMIKQRQRLQRDVERLGQTLSRSKSQIQQLTSELTQSKLTTKTKEDQIQKLNVLIKQKVFSLETDYNERLEAIERENQQEMAKTLNQEREKYQELREKNREKGQQVEEVEREILRVKENYLEEIKLLVEEAKMLRNHKEEIEDMFRHSKDEMRVLEEELRQRRDEAKMSGEKYKATKEQLKIVQEKNSRLQEQVLSLKQEGCQAQKKIKELEGAMKTSKALALQFQKTEAELDILQQKVTQGKQLHSQQLSHLKHNNDSLILEIKSLKQSLKCLQNYNKDLEKSNNSIEKQLTEIKIRRLKDTEEKTSQLVDQLTQSQSQVGKLSSENTLLAQKLEIMCRERRSQDQMTFRGDGAKESLGILENRLEILQKQIRSEQQKSNRYREQSIVQSREIELLESKLLAKEQIIQGLETQLNSTKLNNEVEKTELYSLLNKKVKEIEGLREESGARVSVMNYTSRESIRRSEGTLAFSIQSENTFEEYEKPKIKIEMRRGEEAEDKENRCRYQRSI